MHFPDTSAPSRPASSFFRYICRIWFTTILFACCMAGFYSLFFFAKDYVQYSTATERFTQELDSDLQSLANRLTMTYQNLSIGKRIREKDLEKALGSHPPAFPMQAIWVFDSKGRLKSQKQLSSNTLSMKKIPPSLKEKLSQAHGKLMLSTHAEYPNMMLASMHFPASVTGKGGTLVTAIPTSSVFNRLTYFTPPSYIAFILVDGTNHILGEYKVADPTYIQPLAHQPQRTILFSWVCFITQDQCYATHDTLTSSPYRVALTYYPIGLLDAMSEIPGYILLGALIFLALITIVLYAMRWAAMVTMSRVRHNTPHTHGFSPSPEYSYSLSSQIQKASMHQQLVKLTKELEKAQSSLTSSAQQREEEEDEYSMQFVDITSLLEESGLLHYEMLLEKQIGYYAKFQKRPVIFETVPAMFREVFITFLGNVFSQADVGDCVTIDIFSHKEEEMPQVSVIIEHIGDNISSTQMVAAMLGTKMTAGPDDEKNEERSIVDVLEELHGTLTIETSDDKILYHLHFAIQEHDNVVPLNVF